MSGLITDVEGVLVGNFTDEEGMTGCTVVYLTEPRPAGLCKAGMATSSRQTDSLDDPAHIVGQIDAVLITGGSAYGLDAAGGVMKFLEERDRGLPTLYAKVPCVPTAAIFDLGLGSSDARPDGKSGYSACLKAGKRFDRGNAGAGCGASVGKLYSITNACKGGMGTASLSCGALTVGALSVVNCFGDVVDPKTGAILAGARVSSDSFEFANTLETLKCGKARDSFFSQKDGGNTTICVVATNASLDKLNLNRLAKTLQAALPKTIRPVFTPLDGDSIFALSTEKVDAPLNQVIAMAEECVILSILDAILSAKSAGGIPSAQEIAASK